MLSALATAVVVGLLRTSESASRLRARGLSRRTMQAESEVRRRVAESIHDGPVQELIGLDMILSAARNAAEHGRGDEATGLIDEARELGMRNLRALRDEIVDLGPYAFQELSFDTAIEDCLPVWRRRYGFEVRAGHRAHRPAARDGRRPVPDRPGGGGERRPPRAGARGVDLAPDGRLTGGAAGGRRRPRLRRATARLAAASPGTSASRACASARS